MSDYKILKETTTEGLEIEGRKHMEKGFIPVGGMVPIKQAGSCMEFCQAVWKKTGGPKRAAKAEYPIDFEEMWLKYPTRGPHNNPKKKAFAAWNARYKEVNNKEVFLVECMQGVKLYSAYCSAAGKSGTEYVMQAATFFGPELHYLAAWKIPTKTSNQHAPPKENANLEAWAIEHGHPKPNEGESFAEYRHRLQGLINANR